MSSAFASFASWPALAQAPRKPRSTAAPSTTTQTALNDRDRHPDALDAANEEGIAPWTWPWPPASRPRARTGTQARRATLRQVPPRSRITRTRAIQALEGWSRAGACPWGVYIANTQVQRQRASRACEVRSPPILLYSLRSKRASAPRIECK